MPQRRNLPYIWTTSRPKLLTGESSCEYAAWFKAHHQGWTRQPSDFDAVQWQIEHTALLTETRDRFLASGSQVFTEAQNAFRLQGTTAVLAGRPDLLVVNGGDVLIIDVKTGQERPSHIAQLMIYMYALPRALQQYHDAKIRAEVFYPHPHPPCRPRQPRPGLHTPPGSPHPAHRRSRAPSDHRQLFRVPFLRQHGR